MKELIDKNMKINKAIAILEQVNAKDISLFEFKGKSPFYDYFLVATVNDRAGSAAVTYFGKEFRDSIRNVEGRGKVGWTLIDLGDIVIHLFKEDERGYYDFDSKFMDNKIELPKRETKSEEVSI